MYQGKLPIWLSYSALAIFVLTGCGYSLKQRLKSQFLGDSGIAVALFQNASKEMGAEAVLTNALVRELESQHKFPVVPEDQTRLVLKGKVTSVGHKPVAFTASGFSGLRSYRRIPTEYEVSMQAEIELVDRTNDKRLWFGRYSGVRRMQAPVNRTFDYQAPSSIGLYTQSVLESVYPEIARDICRDAFDDMLEFL